MVKEAFQINLAGTGWCNSLGMCQNLQYAVKVKDTHFFNLTFRALFENLDEPRREQLRQAFLDGTVEISEGPNDGDAVLNVPAIAEEVR